jgi:hypothetical protein
MAYRNRFEVRDKTALVLFAVPVVVLLIWYFYSSHGPARLLLSCYVLIATPFYLLVGSYPPVGTRWFWKVMLSVAALVTACVYVQVQLTDWFRYIDVTLPARMAFGLTATVACLEGWAAWRIVDATKPKTIRD